MRPRSQMTPPSRMMVAWLAMAPLMQCSGVAARAAAGADPALAPRVDAVVGEWLESTRTPSVSIAIVRQGAIVYAKAYGEARIQPAVPATPATRYAIDSVSKEFTAAAVLLLAEQGRLSLDQPLARWFPDLGAAGKVTLRQLLTHTSGIRDYWPQDFVTPEMMQPATEADIIREWVKRPLDFLPGTEWQYSNTGYVLAGAVVEIVSGEKLFDFMTTRLFKPLGMTHVADRSAPAAALDAAGYTRYGLADLHPAPLERAQWLSGAAGLVMPPGDLALWDLSMLGRSLLRPESYAAAFAPTVLRGGGTAAYGLGLDVEQSDGRLRIGHGGSGSGFLAEHRIWPAERAAIIVFTNGDWAAPSTLLERLAFLVLVPAPAEARARAVFAALQEGNIDRSWFTAIGNHYLSDGALDELRASLGPLGPARWIALEHESKRGGMITRRWKILCRNVRLEAIERGYPGGKLDEFMVTRAAD